MNLKQLTLLHYGEYNPLITENLIILILLKKPITLITKLEKICSNILLKFLKKSDEILFQYRHGLIPLDVDKAIAELISKGIVNIIEKDEKKLVVLTEKGLSYVSNIVLPKLKEHPLYNDVFEEINNLYLKPTEELTKMAYKKACHLKYYIKYIGNHKIAYIFDWSNYGDGLVRPYHISMLFTFAHSEDYFTNILKKIPKTAYVNIDDIKEVIYSNELIQKAGKRRLVLLPEIFQKREPPFLTEDKEEGKNYIANLWMIVEAINIFHVLLGIAPSVNELGVICLKEIYFGRKREKIKKESKEEIRLLKEGVIRNDLKKLVEWGVVKKIKCKKEKEVRYQLAAKKYIDYYLGREFRVLDKEVIKNVYNERIKPIVKYDLPKERKYEAKK